MIPDILKPLLDRPRPYSTKRRINLFEEAPDTPNNRHATARDFVAKQPRTPRPRNSTIFVPENDELPRLIREKRGLDEVIAENARTVRGALKTGDHRDLARFHATAVRDFGDPALAEVADFRDQLHKANPRAAQSWLAAMKKELPAETDRMERAIELTKVAEAPVEKGESGADSTDEPPSVNRSDDRIRALTRDLPARFDIKDNPAASDVEPWYASREAGLSAVRSFEKVVETEARKQGVDPDLVKSIMYAENARGHYFGLAKVADGLNLSDTFLPMNIDPTIWKELGIDHVSATDPKHNIRAGVVLIRRIRDRIDTPTPSKIGSIWNFTGRENVNDFGAYVERLYREKPWSDGIE